MQKAPWFVVVTLLAVSGCAQRGNQPLAGTEQVTPTPGSGQSQGAPGLARAGTQPLFIITCNRNADVVHYDAQLAADGTLDPKEPVIVYWAMLAQDGRRKDLNWIERKMAYGITIKPDPSADGFEMTIVAAPQRSITVRKVGSSVRAELVIDGRRAVLESMYIDASDGLIGPIVHYVGLHGTDVQTAERRFEKIIPR